MPLRTRTAQAGAAIGIAIVLALVVSAAPGCGSDGTADSDVDAADGGAPDVVPDTFVPSDGNPCAAGQGYCSGKCVDVSQDPKHCGTCDNECGFGQHCISAMCRASNIQHVVLIVEENHTFDSYFGRYCQARRRARTRSAPPVRAAASARRTPSRAAPRPSSSTTRELRRPIAITSRRASCSRSTTARWTTTSPARPARTRASARGRRARARRTSRSPTRAPSAPTGRSPTRTRSPIATSSRSPAGRRRTTCTSRSRTTSSPTTSDAERDRHLLKAARRRALRSARKTTYTGRTTIADLLLDAGKTFTVYADGYAAAAAAGYGNCPNIASDCNYNQSRTRSRTRRAASTRPTSRSPTTRSSPTARTCRTTRSSPRTWREQLPSFAYVKALDDRNEHPNVSNITDGVTFVQGMIQTIPTRPTRIDALLVTWDEGGGFFDHVAPPPSIDTDDGKNPVPYGTRVPLLALGPVRAEGHRLARDDGALVHRAVPRVELPRPRRTARSQRRQGEQSGQPARPDSNGDTDPGVIVRPNRSMGVARAGGRWWYAWLDGRRRGRARR